MSSSPQPPGCLPTALATAVLVGLAMAFMAIGLTLVVDPGCEGVCETAAVTLLYAGLPVSGLAGVISGDLVVAWPLDVTLWVVLGFWLGRRADARGRPVTAPLIALVAGAVAYGLVLSSLVEMVLQPGGSTT